MDEANHTKNQVDGVTPLLRYLVEVRKRLIHCLIFFSLIFIALIYFANDLYTALAKPLLNRLPEGQGFIATNVLAPFFVPIELTFFVALFLSIPYFLYQLWGFIAPALYRHEKKMILPLIVVSSILFYLGVMFAYGLIFPIIFSFLIKTVPAGVLLSPDISHYLEFSLKLFFIFGIIFEVPVLIILLNWTGIVSRSKLIEMRPYMIVAAFIIGMLFSPPDVISQTLLAIPLWILYEIGIFISGLLINQSRKSDAC